MSKDLVNMIVELREDDALAMAKEMLDDGVSPSELINLGISAMGEIGDRFEAGEYFLPELLMAGEIMEALNDLVLPLMAEGESVTMKEKIILGTVSGDVHDIGKNIVRFLLEANGYEVVDLGIDVEPSTFIEKVKETGAPIVGLSALLTLSYDSMKETVEALESAGLRDQVKVMIGGAPVDDRVLNYVKADARGANAVAAVELANIWTVEEES